MTPALVRLRQLGPAASRVHRRSYSALYGPP